MPWDSDNNCWSSNYWPPRNQNVTFRQKSPPQPTYTRLPALLKTIEEAPAAVLRDSLVHLCRKSAADAENVCKALADPVEPVSKPLDENDEARDDEFEEEETDAIKLLLERALEHRQRQLRTRQPNSDQKRSPSSRGSSESNTGESSSDASSEAKPTVPKAAYQTLINGRICPEQQTPKPKGLAVDDIGPSGKCSSYAYSKNPHCAQRTDKAYIDAIRKKLDKNPQRSRQELINAEKKLEKDRWEMEFEASMRVLNSLPRRNEKCQHCKEIFDATWNDYESCTWHPGKTCWICMLRDSLD